MQSIALYQNGEEIVISEEYGYSPDFWAVSVQCQSGEYKLLEVCKTNAAADSLVDRLAAINAYTVNNEHNQISTFVRIYEEIAAGNLSNERLPSITPTDAAVAIALHSVRHCSDDSSDLGNLLYQGMLRACSEKAFGLIEYPIREVLPVDWNGRVRVVPSARDDDVEEFVPSQGREPDFWPVFVQCWRSGKYQLLEACATKSSSGRIEVDRLVVIDAYAITRQSRREAAEYRLSRPRCCNCAVRCSRRCS